MKLIFLLIGLGLASCDDHLPSFSWDQVHSSADGVPLLNIHFPDGGKDDVALLKRVNSNSCIFNGFLRDESKSYVALTGGCLYSNTFQIQFHSSRLNGFAYQVTGGVVSKINSVFQRAENREDAGDAVITEVTDKAMVTEEFLEMMKRRNLNRAAFPSSGFKLKIKFYYDELFETQFGADVNTRLDSIFALVQGYYFLPTLTTTIRLVATPHQKIPISLTDGADGPTLEVVRPYITDTTINANVFMTFANNAAGTVGIAWLGSTCFNNPTWRASINEYFVNDAQTAQIVAHETGHNLGMDHDFVDDPSVGRNDNNGVSCKNIGGVMDYFQASFDRWSTCSVQDFQAYYDSNIPFCLATDDTETTTTTTTTTESTSTTTTTTAESTSSTTTTTESTSTTTTTLSRHDSTCKKRGGDACVSGCQKYNFSNSYACIMYRPRKLICKCGLFGTPTTTPAPTSTTLRPTQNVCKTVEATHSCRHQCRFGYNYCIVRRPKFALCQCSLYGPSG